METEPACKTCTCFYSDKWHCSKKTLLRKYCFLHTFNCTNNACVQFCTL